MSGDAALHCKVCRSILACARHLSPARSSALTLRSISPRRREQRLQSEWDRGGGELAAFSSGLTADQVDGVAREAVCRAFRGQDDLIPLLKALLQIRATQRSALLTAVNLLLYGVLSTRQSMLLLAELHLAIGSIALNQGDPDRSEKLEATLDSVVRGLQRHTEPSSAGTAPAEALMVENVAASHHDVELRSDWSAVELVPTILQSLVYARASISDAGTRGEDPDPGDDKPSQAQPGRITTRMEAVQALLGVPWPAEGALSILAVMPKLGLDEPRAARVCAKVLACASSAETDASHFVGLAKALLHIISTCTDERVGRDICVGCLRNLLSRCPRQALPNALLVAQHSLDHSPVVCRLLIRHFDRVTTSRTRGGLGEVTGEADQPASTTPRSAPPLGPTDIHILLLLLSVRTLSANVRGLLRAHAAKLLEEDSPTALSRAVDMWRRVVMTEGVAPRCPPLLELALQWVEGAPPASAGSWGLPRLGQSIVELLFVYVPHIRESVLSCVFDALGDAQGRGGATQTYCGLLSRLVELQPKRVVECLDTVKDFLLAVHALDVVVAQTALRSLAPLIRVSAPFFEALYAAYLKMLRRPLRRGLAIIGLCELLALSRASWFSCQREADILVALRPAFSFQLPLRARLLLRLTRMLDGAEGSIEPGWVSVEAKGAEIGWSSLASGSTGDNASSSSTTPGAAGLNDSTLSWLRGVLQGRLRMLLSGSATPQSLKGSMRAPEGKAEAIGLNRSPRGHLCLALGRCYKKASSGRFVLREEPALLLQAAWALCLHTRRAREGDRLRGRGGATSSSSSIQAAAIPLTGTGGSAADNSVVPVIAATALQILPAPLIWAAGGEAAAAPSGPAPRSAINRNGVTTAADTDLSLQDRAMPWASGPDDAMCRVLSLFGVSDYDSEARDQEIWFPMGKGGGGVRVRAGDRLPLLAPLYYLFASKFSSGDPITRAILRHVVARGRQSGVLWKTTETEDEAGPTSRRVAILCEEAWHLRNLGESNDAVKEGGACEEQEAAVPPQARRTLSPSESAHAIGRGAATCYFEIATLVSDASAAVGKLEGQRRARREARVAIGLRESNDASGSGSDGLGLGRSILGADELPGGPSRGVIGPETLLSFIREFNASLRCGTIVNEDDATGPTTRAKRRSNGVEQKPEGARAPRRTALSLQAIRNAICILDGQWSEAVSQGKLDSDAGGTPLQLSEALLELIVLTRPLKPDFPFHHPPDNTRDRSGSRADSAMKPPKDDVHMRRRGEVKDSKDAKTGSEAEENEDGDSDGRYRPDSSEDEELPAVVGPIEDDGGDTFELSGSRRSATSAPDGRHRGLCLSFHHDALVASLAQRLQARLRGKAVATIAEGYTNRRAYCPIVHDVRAAAWALLVRIVARIQGPRRTALFRTLIRLARELSVEPDSESPDITKGTPPAGHFAVFVVEQMKREMVAGTTISLLHAYMDVLNLLSAELAAPALHRVAAFAVDSLRWILEEYRVTHRHAVRGFLRLSLSLLSLPHQLILASDTLTQCFPASVSAAAKTAADEEEPARMQWLEPKCYASGALEVIAHTQRLLADVATQCTDAAPFVKSSGRRSGAARRRARCGGKSASGVAVAADVKRGEEKEVKTLLLENYRQTRKRRKPPKQADTHPGTWRDYGHDWLGRVIVRVFKSTPVSGRVTQWLSERRSAGSGSGPGATPSALWRVEYRNGFCEELDKAAIVAGLLAFEAQQRRDAADGVFRFTCKEKETPQSLARRFDCDAREIIRINPRFKLSLRSCFLRDTVVRVPGRDPAASNDVKRKVVSATGAPTSTGAPASEGLDACPACGEPCAPPPRQLSCAFCGCNFAKVRSKKRRRVDNGSMGNDSVDNGSATTTKAATPTFAPVAAGRDSSSTSVEKHVAFGSRLHQHSFVLGCACNQLSVAIGWLRAAAKKRPDAPGRARSTRGERSRREQLLRQVSPKLIPFISRLFFASSSCAELVRKVLRARAIASRGSEGGAPRSAFAPPVRKSDYAMDTYPERDVASAILSLQGAFRVVGAVVDWARESGMTGHRQWAGVCYQFERWDAVWSRLLATPKTLLPSRGGVPGSLQPDDFASTGLLGDDENAKGLRRVVALARAKSQEIRNARDKARGQVKIRAPPKVFGIRRQRRRIRSRNPIIDRELQDMNGFDSFADLEDWVVPDDAPIE